MEEILRKLQKDASGNKYKAIRDGCAVACGECYTCQQPLWASTRFHPHLSAIYITVHFYSTLKKYMLKTRFVAEIIGKLLY